MTAMTDPSLLFTTSGVEADEPYGGRDPAQELYAHAAGVLANAQALEASASDPGTVAALAPTLACFETSLAALAQATSRLRVHALRRLTDPVLGPDEHTARHRAELATTLERLAGVLDQGSFACTRARAAIDSVNDELTAI
jgi:predicted nucleic acid-binding protein